VSFVHYRFLSWHRFETGLREVVVRRVAASAHGDNAQLPQKA
jgi:hypothetical protein